jgi:hypothetical protein
MSGSWVSSAYQVKLRCPLGFCAPNRTFASAVPWLCPLYAPKTTAGNFRCASSIATGPLAWTASTERGLPVAPTWSISDW